LPTEHAQWRLSDLFGSHDNKLKLYMAFSNLVLRHTWPAVFWSFQLQRGNVKLPITRPDSPLGFQDFPYFKSIGTWTWQGQSYASTAFTPGDILGIHIC